MLYCLPWPALHIEYININLLGMVKLQVWQDGQLSSATVALWAAFTAPVVVNKLKVHLFHFEWLMLTRRSC